MQALEFTCSFRYSGENECKWVDGLLSVDKDNKLSRAQVVKMLWAYLKEHKLQDPQNKQWCNPDMKMEKIFGTEKFKAFGMAKYLKGHLS